LPSTGHFRVIGICAGRSRPANRVPCMQRCCLSCSRTHGVSFLSSELPRALCELHAELKPGGFVRFEPAVIMKKAGTPSAMHLSRPRDLGVAMRRQLAWSNLPHLLIVIEPNLQCDFSPCGWSINAHAKGIFGKIDTLRSPSKHVTLFTATFSTFWYRCSSLKANSAERRGRKVTGLKSGGLHDSGIAGFDGQMRRYCNDIDSDD